MLSSNKVLRRGEAARRFSDLNMKDAETILPGYLVDIDATPEVIAHASAAGTGATSWKGYVADIRGDNKGIDDAYVDADNVNVIVPMKGSEVRLILDLGENVARGALLETAAGGEVQALTTGTPIAVAEEAVNATSAAAAINCTIL